MTAPADTPLFEEFADRFAEAVRDDDPVSGDLFEPPAVEFRPVKPRRFSRKWWVENLSWKRQLAAGSSAVVLVAGFLGWVQ